MLCLLMNNLFGTKNLEDFQSQKGKKYFLNRSVVLYTPLKQRIIMRYKSLFIIPSSTIFC